MGRPRLRKTRDRHGYTHAHVCALLESHDYFRVFGEPFSAAAEAAMIEAWPILRDDVFALLADKRLRGQPCPILPGGWWRFESPEPRNSPFEDEADQLARLGIDPARIA